MSKELTPKEFEAKVTAEYNAEIIRRYNEGLPLTKADKAYAKQLLKNRSTEN